MRFQKRFVALAVCVILAAVLKFHFGSENLKEVEEFRGANIKEDVFSPMIAQSVNSKLMTVTLNDKSYTNSQKSVYMSEQLNIMVSTEALMEGLYCSAHLYGEDTILILQGETEISMKEGEDFMTVNGEEVELITPMTIQDGAVYVPLQPLQSYLNFTLSWDMEDNSGVATTTLEESYLPLKFDLRKYGRMGAVQDQGNYGTCWAFASLSALESSLLPEETVEFSADHMSLRNSFSSDQSQGGEYTMGMAYLTSWQGPVLEKDDPYGDGISPENLKAAKHVQNIELIEAENLNDIKEAVYKHGAVQTSLYCNVRDTSLYNRAYASYYYSGEQSVNHDVVIVGWDDTYPAERFSMKPEGDGAFLCQNSWGSDFGDQGIFYVSYYDSNIGSRCISYIGVEDTDNYDHIYQSDLCGWGGQLGYNKSSLYAANVFTSQQDELMEAVGFYATGPDTSYEIYLVPQFENVTSLKEGWRVASGTKSKPGYYTIKLDSQIKVTKGVKFAVVMKIDTPDSTRPLAVEYAKEDSAVQVDLTDGESYISANGKKWESAEKTQNCNVCIKAYTKDLE